MDNMFKIIKGWLIVMLMFVVSSQAYAEGIKFPSLPKSKVESDIINFDYSQMAYPLKKESIGVVNGNEPKVPQKRVSIGGDTICQDTSMVKDVFENICKFVFILCLTLTFVCVIPDTIITIVCVIICALRKNNGNNIAVDPK